jgi:hypothetical protein
MLFLPPRYKALLVSPKMFSLYFCSLTVLPDSLFGFKGLKQAGNAVVIVYIQAVILLVFTTGSSQPKYVVVHVDGARVYL